MSVAQAAADPVAPQLRVRNVHLWRGERHLLRGVTFELNAGELLQIVGPNGVGKTSLLRCVAGLLPMESGEVEWCGVNVQRAADIYQQQLSYLAHANALKPELTALENLRYLVSLRRAVDEDELRMQLRHVQLEHCAELPTRALSAGQKRRLALARVLLSRSTLWVLDEPITNLDASGVALFEACMGQHLDSGGLVLTAAHQLLLHGRSGVRTLELRS